ncbi:MAG: dihydroorotate dehydrogenase-like protein [Acidobacteriota bacterium]|nr:dihydroorotate dehydrogenase-like protein [Acidobacteriota bacterium]
MNLTTSYLGLKLAHPLIPGACPLTAELDSILRLEDAGAPAIVLHSLYEEQIAADPLRTERSTSDPVGYLEHVNRVKESVHIPVIASLNGTTDEGWTSFAPLVEQAGADALELNLYHLSTNLWTSGATLEAYTLDTVRAVRTLVSIPIAVKVFPYFSSIPSLARQFEEIGVNGLILFNRSYQPDIDLETLEVKPDLKLSSSAELLSRLYWIAMLADRVDLSLAVTGGVHTGADALKAILAGADAIQMVSALLLHGPGHLGAVRQEMERWLEAHGHSSLDEIRGIMSLEKREDSRAFSRAGVLEVLQRGIRPGG